MGFRTESTTTQYWRPTRKERKLANNVNCKIRPHAVVASLNLIDPQVNRREFPRITPRFVLTAHNIHPEPRGPAPQPAQGEVT